LRIPRAIEVEALIFKWSRGRIEGMGTIIGYACFLNKRVLITENGIGTSGAFDDHGWRRRGTCVPIVVSMYRSPVRQDKGQLIEFRNTCLLIGSFQNKVSIDEKTVSSDID
jgi:hypothetical protein